MARPLNPGLGTTFFIENSGGSYLPHELRRAFLKKMKKTVVMIRYIFIDGEGRRQDKSCGGVIIDDFGRILTCGTELCGPQVENIWVKCEDEATFRTAHAVFLGHGCLVVLEPDESRTSECFVSFASDKEIDVGVQALAIAHSEELTMGYNFTIGMVSFPCDTLETKDQCYATTSAFFHTPKSRRMIDLELEPENNPGTSDTMKLIQVINTQLDEGAKGCPIFNPTGLVMGLFFYRTENYEFFIHAKYLIKFVDELRQKLSPKGCASTRFWGVEVEPRRTLHCQVRAGSHLDITQIAVGEAKTSSDEEVLVSIEAEGEITQTIGNLSTHDNPQLKLNEMTVSRNFALSHSLESTPLYVMGKYVPDSTTQGGRPELISKKSIQKTKMK